MNTYRAFRTGLRDGWESPHDMSVGMTYENSTRQWAWDQGSLLGQRAARLRQAWNDD